jgi:hypothetical protein
MPRIVDLKNIMRPAMQLIASWITSKLARARMLPPRLMAWTAIKKCLLGLGGKASGLRNLSECTNSQENHNGAYVMATTKRIGSYVEDQSNPTMTLPAPDMSSMNEPHSQEKSAAMHTTNDMSARPQSTQLLAKDHPN